MFFNNAKQRQSQSPLENRIETYNENQRGVWGLQIVGKASWHINNNKHACRPNHTHRPGPSSHIWPYYWERIYIGFYGPIRVEWDGDFGMQGASLPLSFGRLLFSILCTNKVFMMAICNLFGFATADAFSTQYGLIAVRSFFPPPSFDLKICFIPAII